MKKLLLLVAIATFLGKPESCTAKVQINKNNYRRLDTLQYLKDNVLAKKHLYVGKPLSVLLGDLQVDIKLFGDLFSDDLYRTLDSVRTPTLSLYFNNQMFEFETLLKKGEKGSLHIPYLLIKFDKLVALDKKYWMTGLPFQNLNWSAGVASFFGSYTVSEIEVLEY